MARLVREPLLHFLILGALIFAAAQWRERAEDPHRIVVDAARVARLSEGYVQQYGEAPSPATMRALIDRYAEQEALYREGRAMGLDREDEVVRRRIVQKTQFLKQDLDPPAEPDEAALRRFYAAHAGRYLTPLQTSFSHIYFSTDRAGDAAAMARARSVLAGLVPATVRAPERGDPFPDLYDYAGLDKDALGRVFGRTPLAQAVMDAPVGRWAGPFKSGYGWHLVRVSARTAPAQQSFEDVRATVRADYVAQAREDANQRALAKIRARYTVIVEKGIRAMSRALVIALIAWMGGVLWSSQASAHEVRPAYLEITQQGPGAYQVLWKQPVQGELALPLNPRLSNGWLDQTPAQVGVTAAQLTRIWRIRTQAAAPLDGATVSVDGLDRGITDVLVRVAVDDRRPVEAILNPDRPQAQLSFQSTSGLPTPAYLMLGIGHILTGLDHLAFVLGLMLLVGANRRLVAAVTAFTVAHSLTLAASALGLIHVPSAAIEALVALSILFVAQEILRAQRGDGGLTLRRPWLIAFAFGLLHGFAFAGALAEIGLPPHAIPQALFLFNVGVEIGQLMFIGATIAAMFAAQRLRTLLKAPVPALASSRAAPAYVIGAFAAYWFIERMASAFLVAA